MLREFFVKELANLVLNEMHHNNEASKGYDVEYHEREARDSNIRWNEARRIAQAIYGSAEAMQICIEAREEAKKAFSKGEIFIESEVN